MALCQRVGKGCGLIPEGRKGVALSQRVGKGVTLSQRARGVTLSTKVTQRVGG